MAGWQDTSVSAAVYVLRHKRDVPASSHSAAAAGVAVLFSSHQLDPVEDLCEDMVIIDHGLVVPSGRVSAFPTKAAHRFLSLAVRGADTARLADPDVTSQ